MYKYLKTEEVKKAHYYKSKSRFYSFIDICSD